MRFNELTEQSQLDEFQLNPTGVLASIIRWGAENPAVLAALGIAAGGGAFALTSGAAVLGPLMAAITSINAGQGALGLYSLDKLKDLIQQNPNQAEGYIKKLIYKYVGDQSDVQEFEKLHAQTAYKGETKFRWRAENWPVTMDKNAAESWLEKNDKYWLDTYNQPQGVAEGGSDYEELQDKIQWLMGAPHYLKSDEARETAAYTPDTHSIWAGYHDDQLTKKNESVTEAKSLHKRVKIVKGQHAGKYGWIREIKHGAYKGAPKTYYVDVEGGDQANNLSSSELRLAKDQTVAEGPELKQAKRKYNQAAKDANIDQVGAGKKIDTMKKSLRQKDLGKEQALAEGANDMTPNWAKYVLDQIYNSNGSVTMTDLFDEGIPGLHAMFMATAQEHGLDSEEEFEEVQEEVLNQLEDIIKGGHGSDLGESDSISLGKVLPWPELVNQISSAMRAMGWKGSRKADGSFMFSTKGQLQNEWYIVIIDNRGNDMFTYALGTIEEDDPYIGEQETMPMTAASISELMNAIREGFGMNENIKESNNPYGYEVGQTVKLHNGSRGRVIDIFDDSIEVLLPGGRTVTVDFRDAEVLDEQSSAPGVDAKGRTQSQWLRLVKTKFPSAKIQQAKMIDGPVIATLDDGRSLSWTKVKQGMAEAGFGRATGRAAWDSNMPGYQGDYGGASNWGRREREDDEHHEIDRRMEQEREHRNTYGTWYVRIDGLVEPTPYQGKAAANAAALELKNRPGNENKLFMLTTKA